MKTIQIVDDCVLEVFDGNNNLRYEYCEGDERGWMRDGYTLIF